MSTKNLRQIIDDMSDDEFESFATAAFLELVARDIDANPDNLVIADDQFFAEIDDLIGDVEPLSNDVVVEPVLVKQDEKTPDVSELTNKTLEAIVTLDRQGKRLDALAELSELDQEMGRYDE